LPGNVALGRDFKLVGAMFDMPCVWEERASNLVTHAIPECGHLPHEEKPEEINRLLFAFLADWKG
jgi:haloacetate dehalogenase